MFSACGYKELKFDPLSIPMLCVAAEQEKAELSNRQLPLVGLHCAVLRIFGHVGDGSPRLAH
jgi:hypothetical protein